MKVSYKKLQTYFNDPLPSPEKLAEALSFHFAEVESIEKEGDDSILDIKVLPDRATYAKSYEGIALEVSAIFNIQRRSAEPVKTDKVIEADVEKINSVLGMDIPATEIISILTRLDIAVVADGDMLTLSIPENRKDLNDWRDIPEEVGRIYGYDKIPTKMPAKLESKSGVNKMLYYAEKIKNIFVERGFSEVYTYALVSKGVFHIEKSVASDKNYLRANLTDGIAKSLELNARNADLLGLDEIKIFEIGNVFCEEGEHTALSIGIRNVKKKPFEGMSKEEWKEKEKIKKVRDELLKIIDAGTTILCSVDDMGGVISIGGKTIGITNHVDGVMELNLDALVATLPEPQSYDDLNFGKAVSVEYKKFPTYPFIVRDIAVFVPDVGHRQEEDGPTTVWQSIEKGIVEAGAMDLLVRHSLFDTFKKDGKTSYAFRMIFQTMDRNLTDVEINTVMERVNEEVKGRGWEVR